MREEKEQVPLSRSDLTAWRRQLGDVSLPEVHRSIIVPSNAPFWRKMFAFAGPGFLVAVGYMDPGNWATDLSGGAQFGYTLLCVILISNLMAILLQHLCVKLGVVTGEILLRRAVIITPGRPFCFYGSFVSWPLQRAISPRWSVQRLACSFFSEYPWFGAASSPVWMCWLCSIFKIRDFVTSRL